MDDTAARAGMDKPDPPPEAALIRLVRDAAHIKTPVAARAAGISTARWSQVENGYETKNGRYVPVRGPAATVAHMAAAVGVDPDRLEDCRPDAAEILREILRARAAAEVPARRTSLSQRQIEIVTALLDSFRDDENGGERPA